MTKRFILLDSCVLASFLLDFDLNHNEAVQIIKHLFDKTSQFKIILPPLAFYETGVAVLRAGNNSELVAERLHKLIKSERVTVISLSELAVFKHLERTARSNQREKQIKTQDMYILNTAIDFDAPIVTFDKPLLDICKRLQFPGCSNLVELMAYQL